MSNSCHTGMVVYSGPMPTSITLSTRSVTTLGTLRDWMMSISHGSRFLFSLDLVRTYARTFTLWVTEIAVVGCIAQLFYAWRMYKFSKKARWVMYYPVGGKVFKKVLYCSLKTRSSSNYDQRSLLLNLQLRFVVASKHGTVATTQIFRKIRRSR